MRKCLWLNICNGVTAVSEQQSGADPALLPAVVLAEVRHLPNRFTLSTPYRYG